MDLHNFLICLLLSFLVNYVCSNNLGSYSCDLVPSSLLVPVDGNGNPTDGLTPWQNKDDQTEVIILLGVGLDGVTPDGTITIDGIPGMGSAGSLCPERLSEHVC